MNTIIEQGRETRGTTSIDYRTIVHSLSFTDS